MRAFLTQLDWTPYAKASFQSHWRLHLCAAVGAVLSIYVWRSIYPNGHGFTILWAGAATGLAAGIVPGAIWQLYSPARRATTSGRWVIKSGGSWGLMALLAVFLLGPFLRSQESERLAFRAISTREIVAITVNGKRHNASVTRQGAIDDLLERVAASDLFYPSHELPSEEFQLNFHFKGGDSSSFMAWVPERHPDDIAVSAEPGNMLLRGGREWLDGVTE